MIAARRLPGAPSGVAASGLNEAKRVRDSSDSIRTLRMGPPSRRRVTDWKKTSQRRNRCVKATAVWQRPAAHPTDRTAANLTASRAGREAKKACCGGSSGLDTAQVWEDRSASHGRCEGG